jgi:cell wall-associated NlpC family hydrolase
LRSLARRLLPVVTFTAGLGLCLAAMPGQPGMAATSVLPFGSAPAARLEAISATNVSGQVGAIPGAKNSGIDLRSFASGPVPAAAVVTNPAQTTASQRPGRLSHLLQADVLLVAQTSLPAGLVSRLRHVSGVVAAVPVDAGRIKVNGVFVNVLGVNPAGFRPFAAGPTARSAALWQNVAAGGIAVSYTMGHQDRVALNKPVRVDGARSMNLPVAGFGTVGIGGVDAVVSGAVGRRLGLPAANAIVLSAPKARLDRLMAKLKKLAPRGTAVAPLVTQVIMGTVTVTSGAAGAVGDTTGQGPGLTAAQTVRFLAAAESRLGMPYVWGGAGPRTFDCSGLVQWSMRQAGILMPRVAADQARTGPLIKLSDLRPGDLLFYHTDPTAPSYISHVAIYIGNDEMLQAPEPGLNVEVVPADFGAGFAGAVRVYASVAAAVAGNPAG